MTRLAILANVAALSLAGIAANSASAAAPVCIAGFATAASSNWLLQCAKTVPIAQKGVALTEAQNAVCKTERYWNFGPKVESKTNRIAGTVQVTYTCGHVEG
jgi:hypothetical protein